MIPIPGINTLVKAVGGIFDEFIHSGEEKASAKLKLGALQHSMVQDALKFEIEQVKAQASIILAEAKAGWLTRNWRPMLMFVFMAIIVNNFIIWPYQTQLGFEAEVLEFPKWMQDLLKLGVTGYIGARSAEKIIPTAIDKWKNGGKKPTEKE